MTEHSPHNAFPQQEASLIEIHPGVAAIFSDKKVPGLDTLKLDLLNPETTANLTSELSKLTSLIGLDSTVSASHAQLQGLVQLTPKTLEDLKKFTPIKVAGSSANYGILLDGSKKFAAHIQWVPFDPATLTAIAGANIPVMATLVAMTKQLTSIEKKVDLNIDLTRQAINEIRIATQEDRWSTLISMDHAITKAVEEAHVTGEVSNHVFAPIQSKETYIIKSRELFTRKVHEHLEGLADLGENQQKYLTENVNSILNDSYGLLLAEWTRHRWNVLRAANISLDSSSQALLSTVLENSEKEYEQSRGKLEELLRALVHQLNLMKVLTDDHNSGLRGRIPWGRRKETQEVADRAAELAATIAHLSDKVFQEPALPAPALEVFKTSSPEYLYKVLQWSLPAGENLVAVADVNQGLRNSYLGITDQSFFITGQGELRKNGQIERMYPLDDVRYVRFVEREKGSPELHIITKDENLSVTFDRWISKGVALEDARRLADVLATVMDIPDSERREDILMADFVDGRREITL